jgi:hypothetical protein
MSGLVAVALVVQFQLVPVREVAILAALLTFTVEQVWRVVVVPLILRAEMLVKLAPVVQ